MHTTSSPVSGRPTGECLARLRDRPSLAPSSRAPLSRSRLERSSATPGQASEYRTWAGRVLPISLTEPCLALTHREHPATSRTHGSRALTKQGRTRSLRHTACHLPNSSTHREVPSRTSTITGPHLTFLTSDLATLPAQASAGALPSLSHVPTTRQTRSIGRTSDAPTAEERVRMKGIPWPPTYLRAEESRMRRPAAQNLPPSCHCR